MRSAEHVAMECLTQAPVSRQQRCRCSTRCIQTKTIANRQELPIQAAAASHVWRPQPRSLSAISSVPVQKLWFRPMSDAGQAGRAFARNLQASSNRCFEFCRNEPAWEI